MEADSQISAADELNLQPVFQFTSGPVCSRHLKKYHVCLNDWRAASLSQVILY